MANYKTMDSELTKEFSDMTRIRRKNSSFDIRRVPLPEFPHLLKNFSKGDVYVVKGIKEPFFEKLNGFPVQILTTTNLEARKVLSDGSFMRDENGNYKYTPVEVKQGFVAVTTKKVINYRRSTVVNGVEVKTKVREGYRYIDYYDLDGERRYIYTIPKDCLVPIDLNVLVITVSIAEEFSKGIEVVLQSGHHIFVHVTPYSLFRNKQKFRLIGAKISDNFDLEIEELFSFWEKEGIIFNRELTTLESFDTIFPDKRKNLAFIEHQPYMSTKEE